MTTKARYWPPKPSTLRLTLAATLIAAGALALYRHVPANRWIAIVAGVLAVILLAWWKGAFVTTIAGRWITMVTRRLLHRTPPDNAVFAETPVDARATVALELGPPAGDPVPLALIAGYLDRYGVRCSSIRLTSADFDTGASGTWVSLTLSAADNLSALQARSARIPLRETADTVARRLADHLRELGWQVHRTDNPARPLSKPATESWRGLSDDGGYLAAYRAAVNDGLAETLRTLESDDPVERWVVIELTGHPQTPALAAACAVRTPARPATAPPGLIACSGEHARMLHDMDPLSTDSLGAGTPVDGDLLDTFAWPTTRAALV